MSARIDIEAIRKAFSDKGFARTHWEDCELVNGHYPCAVQKLIQEIERARTVVEAAQEWTHSYNLHNSVALAKAVNIYEKESQ